MTTAELLGTRDAKRVSSPVSPQLHESLEKLALLDSPKVLNVFDWKRIRDEFFPIIRQELRLVDLEPPPKG